METIDSCVFIIYYVYIVYFPLSHLPNTYGFFYCFNIRLVHIVFDNDFIFILYNLFIISSHFIYRSWLVQNASIYLHQELVNIVMIVFQMPIRNMALN